MERSPVSHIVLKQWFWQGKHFMRKKNKKQEKTRHGDRRAVAALAAISFSIVIFVILTIIQNNIINGETKTSVVVCLKTVPKGATFTEENVARYFTTELRNVDDLPQNYLTDTHALIGQVAVREIVVKEIVTTNTVEREIFYEGIENPVEFSIDVSKIGQAVGGSLRAGDLIDIMVVVDMSYAKTENEETDNFSSYGDFGFFDEQTITDESIPEQEVVKNITETIIPSKAEQNANGYHYSVTGKYACIPILSNVRVVNSYNSAGQPTSEAEADGSVQVATIINIVIPRSKESMVALALEEGTLRLSKIIDTMPTISEETGDEEDKSDAPQPQEEIEETENAE